MLCYVIKRLNNLAVYFLSNSRRRSISIQHINNQYTPCSITVDYSINIVKNSCAFTCHPSIKSTIFIGSLEKYSCSSECHFLFTSCFVLNAGPPECHEIKEVKNNSPGSYFLAELQLEAQDFSDTIS